MKFKPKALPITSRALFTIVGGAVLINPVFAQEQASEMDEVVVTGIRGSLKASMETKRDATGVVDAISAEDIGKFPDTNLAESLQRITGVSIDRVNGEGSAITVRGFGPGFNLVTLNGRQLPAAHVGTITGNSDNVGAQGTTRSFDFSTLASEGVSGLEVWKTGNAAAPSGGIGATLNIKTIRPLESGDRASVGVKAVMDESGGSDITPELSGLVSWANDGETFGISAFASYQERQSGSRGVNVSQYQFLEYSDTLPNFLPGAEIVNAPEDGALIAIPANMGLNVAEIERERINGMVTFQWAPSENTTITADAMYTSQTLASDNLVPGIWFTRAYSYAEFDGNDVVATPIKLIEPISTVGGRGKDLFYASWDDNTKDESTTIGLNFNHRFNDAWSMDFDAATSTSESGGDGPGGNNSVRMNVAAAGAGWQGAYYGGGVPTATVGVLENQPNAHGNGNNVLDIPDVSTQTYRTIFSAQETDTDQFNLTGAWDNEQGVSVKFGAGMMTTKMHAQHSETQDFLGGWGVGFDRAPGGESDIPDPSHVTQVNAIAEFDDLNFDGYPDAERYPATGYYMTTLGAESFQVRDPWAFAHAMQDCSQYSTVANCGDGGGLDGDPTTNDFWDADNLTQVGYDNNTINEDIYSAFVQAKFDGEIGGMTTQTVVGLRYERTKVEAEAQQNVVDYFVWQSDNDFGPVFGTDLVPLSASADYSNWLPNIDFAVNVTDSLKVRASVSQTIARPAYNNMFMTTGVGAGNTPSLLGGRPTAQRGNARLDPLESTNLDISVEYYYSDSSYASIGFFTKSVNNFVGTGVTEEELFGLQNMASGAPGTLSGDAAAALQAEGFAVNEQNLFTMAAILSDPDNFPGGSGDFIDPGTDGGAQQALIIIADYDIAPSGCTPAGVLVCGTGTDPLYTFSMTQPVNTETAKIDGIEVAWQHFFGDSGFGFQANATFVNGDVGYDLGADPDEQQFALEGLSDSANAVLIYEKHGFSARVAYNWRDAFLQSTVYAGNAGMPGFVDEYKQVDFNLTYTFNDSLSLGIDGINVTGEGQIIYSRTKQMQWWNAEGDPRWMFTARYNFN